MDYSHQELQLNRSGSSEDDAIGQADESLSPEVKQFLKSVRIDEERNSDHGNQPELMAARVTNNETGFVLNETRCSCHNHGAVTVDFSAPEHWQNNFVTTTQRLSELFSLGHLSDVTITFADSNEVIKAHKLVLASASFVLERMLYTDTKEARTGNVQLHCDVEGFKWILENLYRGTNELENVVMALKVFSVAQVYQMDGIAAICKDFVKYHVSLDNVSDVFNVAKVFSEDTLLNACLLKLNSSWSEMIKNQVSEMTEELWFYLLQQPVLSTPEVMIFKGLLSWAAHRLEEQHELPSPFNIRRTVNKFLPHLRLLSIPVDDFVDHVVPTEVFTHAECTGLMMRLRGMSNALPHAIPCSKIFYSRIDLSNHLLKYVVLARTSGTRQRQSLTAVTDMVLINGLTASAPILVQQIQTNDSSTLKNAQMIVTSADGIQVGVGKALGSIWRFVPPVFMHAKKPYKVSIDKVLVRKSMCVREFDSSAGDIKFKGSTVDNFIRLGFWSAHTRKYS